MKAILLAVLAISVGCSENSGARNFGGTIKIALPCDTKLVVATWKNGDLWYLTRAIRTGEEPETQEFTEKSALGLLNGRVLFGESICK